MSDNYFFPSSSPRWRFRRLALQLLLCLITLSSLSSLLSSVVSSDGGGGEGRVDSLLLYAAAQPYHSYEAKGWISGAPFRWRLALNDSTSFNFRRYYMNLIQKDLREQLIKSGDNRQVAVTLRTITPRLPSKGYVPAEGCDVTYYVANTKYSSAKELNVVLSRSPMTNLATEKGQNTFFDESSPRRWIPCTPAEAYHITRQPQLSFNRYDEAVKGTSLFWSVVLDEMKDKEYKVSDWETMPLLDLLMSVMQEDMQDTLDYYFSSFVVITTLPPAPYVNASAFFIHYDVYLTNTNFLNSWKESVANHTEASRLNATLFFTDLNRTNKYFDEFVDDNPRDVEDYEDIIPTNLTFRPFALLRDGEESSGSSSGEGGGMEDWEVIQTNASTVVLYFAGVAAGWTEAVNRNTTTVVRIINDAVAAALQRANVTYTVGTTELRLLPDTVSTPSAKKGEYFSLYPAANAQTNPIPPLTQDILDAYSRVRYENENTNRQYRIGLMAFVHVEQHITRSTLHAWNGEEMAVQAIYADFSPLMSFYDTKYDYMYNFYYGEDVSALEAVVEEEGDEVTLPQVFATRYPNNYVVTPSFYSSGTLYDQKGRPLRYRHTAGMVYMGVAIVGCQLIAFLVTLLIDCCYCKKKEQEEEREAMAAVVVEIGSDDTIQTSKLQRHGSITDSLVDRIVAAVSARTSTNTTTLSKERAIANKGVQVEFVSTLGTWGEEEDAKWCGGTGSTDSQSPALVKKAGATAPTTEKSTSSIPRLQDSLASVDAVVVGEQNSRNPLTQAYWEEEKARHFTRRSIDSPGKGKETDAAKVVEGRLDPRDGIVVSAQPVNAVFLSSHPPTNPAPVHQYSYFTNNSTPTTMTGLDGTANTIPLAESSSTGDTQRSTTTTDNKDTNNNNSNHYNHHHNNNNNKDANHSKSEYPPLPPLPPIPSSSPETSSPPMLWMLAPQGIEPNEDGSHVKRKKHNDLAPPHLSGKVKLQRRAPSSASPHKRLAADGSREERRRISSGGRAAAPSSSPSRTMTVTENKDVLVNEVRLAGDSIEEKET